MDDLISRQAAVDALKTGLAFHSYAWGVAATIILSLPSAQTEYKLDEWCTDCKEYDNEMHCCPRFNRVIRTAIEDSKVGKWISCKERLPEHSGDYIVTIKSNAADVYDICTCYYDGAKWRVYDFHVTAWMALPEEPYQEEQDG